MKNKCKHNMTFAWYEYTPEYREMLRRGEFSLGVNEMIRIDKKWDQLTKEEKEHAERRLQESDFSWMRCSEHCGNTVRDK